MAQPFITASIGQVRLSGLFDPRTFPFLAHHEGTVLKAYRCPAGKVTIGNGFTMDSDIFAGYWRKQHGRGLQLGDVITRGECAALLPLMVEEEYGKTLGSELPRAAVWQRGAAVSVLYNCGTGARKWRWFAFLKSGQAKASADALRVTAVTARGRRLPGLVRRRKEEADIIAFNSWPSWVRRPADLTPEALDAAKPKRPLEDDDFDQGLQWLVELGFLAPAHDDEDITAAVLKFQAAHRQLTADGILGRATLDQLQRVTDLKRKAKTAGGSGGGLAGAGAADKAADASGYGDMVIWGGLAFAVIGCAVLAWIYRDELKIAFGRRG